jgi:fructose-1,6-bisphosphatase/inositol monophosphatase family enzyme
MAKPSIRNLVTDLAATLREEVLPHLGGHAGRTHSGEAEGGDVTFQIDEHAERRMEGYLAERAPEVSFYSEDRGLVSPEGAPA